MKRMLTALAVLGAAIPSISAQDLPGDQDLKRDSAWWPSEVRVYVFDKDKKAFDDKETTATLILEDKTPGAAPAQKKMVPMQWVAPKAGDKQDFGYHGQVRNVEGTNYVVEFVTLKSTTPKFPDRDKDFDKDKKDKGYKEGDPKSTETPTTEPNDKPNEPKFREQGYKKEGDTLKQEDRRPGDKVDDEWFRWHKHDAGYFKADLTKEQLPTGTKDFAASVQFNFKGETKTVSGFTFGALGRGWRGEKHEIWRRLSEDMMTVERSINAHDMEKARATVDRMVQDLEKAGASATGEQKKDMDACLKDFRDLQQAIHTGNRDKAMVSVKKCREKCDEHKASWDDAPHTEERVK